MIMVLGLAICVLSIGWIKFSSYYPWAGWILLMIGGYLIFRGREKMGLKNK